jgi:hypothetical protein
MSCATAQEEITVTNDPITPRVSAPSPQITRPKPRDGDVAIREEFALAIVEGQVANLELFMRRHPDHPLADIARIILNRGLFEQSEGQN